MALFGFAINFNTGETSYGMVSRPTEQEAQDFLDGICGPASNVESLVFYDTETIVQEQYRGMVIFGTEWQGRL